MSEKITRRWITCRIERETVTFWTFTRSISDGEVTETPVPIRLTINFVKALIQVGIRITCKDSRAEGERIRATVPARLNDEVVQTMLELCCIQLDWDPKEVYYMQYVEEISSTSTI